MAPKKAKTAAPASAAPASPAHASAKPAKSAAPSPIAAAAAASAKKPKLAAAPVATPVASAPAPAAASTAAAAKKSKAAPQAAVQVAAAAPPAAPRLMRVKMDNGSVSKTEILLAPTDIFPHSFSDLKEHRLHRGKHIGFARIGSGEFISFVDRGGEDFVELPAKVADLIYRSVEAEMVLKKHNEATRHGGVKVPILPTGVLARKQASSAAFLKVKQLVAPFWSAKKATFSGEGRARIRNAYTAFCVELSKEPDTQLLVEYPPLFQLFSQTVNRIESPPSPAAPAATPVVGAKRTSTQQKLASLPLVAHGEDLNDDDDEDEEKDHMEVEAVVVKGKAKGKQAASAVTPAKSAAAAKPAAKPADKPATPVVSAPKKPEAKAVAAKAPVTPKAAAAAVKSPAKAATPEASAPKKGKSTAKKAKLQ